MKRTQKDIQNEIKELEDKISDINNIRKHRPELSTLEAKIAKIKEEYFDEITSSVNCWHSDIKALQKELTKKKSEKELQLSEELAIWLHVYKSGIDFGYGGLKVTWVSPDERFLILTNKGCITGTGTAMGTGGYYYSATSHALIDRTKGKEYLYNKSLMEVEGRLSKENKKEMIALAEKTANCSYETKLK